MARATTKAIAEKLGNAIAAPVLPLDALHANYQEKVGHLTPVGRGWNLPRRALRWDSRAAYRLHRRKDRARRWDHPVPRKDWRSSDG